MRAPRYTKAQLAGQAKESISPDILFSLIVPLYNTPERFLREMIASVTGQTYGGWELCMADGSDGDHAYVGRICREYAGRDSRIRYRKTENLGIAGNSNACLEMASGEFVALLDHDDVLHPAALYETAAAVRESGADVIYTDEAVFISPDLKNVIHVHHKPDYGPDDLRANNYFCHFTVFRRSLLEKTGPFRLGFDGSQDHDLVLRLTAATDRIRHIPEVLYYWRAHSGSSAHDTENKTYAYLAGEKAVSESLQAAGIPARVERNPEHPGFYRVHYALQGRPLVSIVISGGNAEERERCISSVTDVSSYRNVEIITADAPAPASHSAEAGGASGRAPAVNSAVGSRARGEYVLLLDGRAQVLSPEWIEEMLMYAQRGDVGAAGAMLYDQDDRVWHAGMILGIRGTAGNAFRRFRRGAYGFCGRLQYAQDLSAVSGACMMVRRSLWDELGGLDTGYGAVLADADLCMRIRRKGRLVVWTPYAELRYPGPDRWWGEEDLPDGAGTGTDEARFAGRWAAEIAAGDPYYNPNLTLARNDFSFAWKVLER